MYCSSTESYARETGNSCLPIAACVSSGTLYTVRKSIELKWIGRAITRRNRRIQVKGNTKKLKERNTTSQRKTHQSREERWEEGWEVPCLLPDTFHPTATESKRVTKREAQVKKTTGREKDEEEEGRGGGGHTASIGERGGEIYAWASDKDSEPHNTDISLSAGIVCKSTKQKNNKNQNNNNNRSGQQQHQKTTDSSWMHTRSSRISIFDESDTSSDKKLTPARTHHKTNNATNQNNRKPPQIK